MAQTKAGTTTRICALLAGLLLSLPGSCLAQGVAPTPPQQAEPAAAPPPAANQNTTGTPAKTAPRSSGDLDSVLAQMDEAAAHFKSAKADVELVQYTAVLKGTGDEKDVQTGRIYFRRKGHDTEVALWIEKPHPKQAVVKDDKVTFFDPRTKQVTQRDLGSSKTDVEAVMNLGFGGRGSDLRKEYTVTMDGWENLDGIKAAKLELVAKSESLRRLFTKMVLWVDPARAVALQQQRFESSGDYQFTHYTNINLSSNIPDDRFVVKK